MRLLKVDVLWLILFISMRFCGVVLLRIVVVLVILIMKVEWLFVRLLVVLMCVKIWLIGLK